MDTNSLGMGDGGLGVIRTLLSLILVIGMMVAAYYWLKRRGTVPGATTRRMRVVERLPIDARRSLLLLEVDGEELVVGVGSDTLSPIKSLKKKGGDDA